MVKRTTVCGARKRKIERYSEAKGKATARGTILTENFPKQELNWTDQIGNSAGTHDSRAGRLLLTVVAEGSRSE
jgi:hypothetical protein